VAFAWLGVMELEDDDEVILGDGLREVLPAALVPRQKQRKRRRVELDEDPFGPYVIIALLTGPRKDCRWFSAFHRGRAASRCQVLLGRASVDLWSGAFATVRA
jgi:hypothetical protein